MQKDTRHLIRIGDYFNITRPLSNSITWNEVNRFDTYQLIDIDDTGRWEVKKLFYEYSKGDYPFFSDTSYWDVLKYAQDCLVERINDPETEGFKDKKPYIQNKIESRVKELKDKYKSVAKYVAYQTILNKHLHEDITRLVKIANALNIYGITLDTTAIDVDYDLPYVSTYINGNKVMGVVETMYFDSFDVDTNIGKFNIKFKDLVSNDILFPIDFALCFPYLSVAGTNEAESLACDILLQMKTWSSLPTYDQYYKTISTKDRIVSSMIERDFYNVIEYLSSPEKCATFSKKWAEIFEKHNKKL